MRLLRGSDCRTKAGLLYSKENDGAHARIRTGDLFLTKWSLDPGVFDLILVPSYGFGRDHLPNKETVLLKLEPTGGLEPPAFSLQECALSVPGLGGRLDLNSTVSFSGPCPQPHFLRLREFLRKRRENTGPAAGPRLPITTRIWSQ